ncbi:MAG: hypothetical protein Q9M94_02790 [Candidatus Gracilibacteria bacterium]|nr:hypothetical protein [Candidatus Gracilibacteria bacterium]MDQ7022689.1 hypothetical protein [Candidatus Gracilibacteria bacterium]
MTTKTITKENEEVNKLILEKQEIKTTQISAADSAEIEAVFNEANDFRSIGEKITAPLDDIISKTAKVIDADPIMKISDELRIMNGEVQEVYSDIIDNDGNVMKFFKSIPLLGNLVKGLDAKFDEASFNMKGIEGKINVIFGGFDTAYNSVNSSIDLQREFLDGIDESLGKVIAYKNFVSNKSIEFAKKLEETTDEKEKTKLSMFLRNVDFFQGNLVVLIGNLEMARKRLLMRLDSANKLSLAMNSSRPIFKVLLSTAIIETSSQKAIDASMAAMEVMGNTIDKMSSDLTDKAISSNKKAEEMSAKPVLSTTVFIENVTKLKNHFDSIDAFREQIQIEAKAERKTFEEAKEKLDNMKILTAKETDELNKELS